MKAEHYFVKRTSRGDWAVRGNAPNLPTVICTTKEEADRYCADMNRAAQIERNYATRVTPTPRPTDDE